MQLSLSDYINRCGCALTPHSYTSLLAQILKGIEHIHKHNFIHRDIKPDNILLSRANDDGLIVKIADLGLSKDLSDSKQILTSYIASRWYRAPELALRNDDYTQAVDIWAFAVVACEIANSKPLFPGKCDIEQLRLQISKFGTPHPLSLFGDWDALSAHITRNESLSYLDYLKDTCHTGRFEVGIIKPHLLSTFTDLLILAFQWDPSKRATASELLNSRILAGAGTVSPLGIVTESNLNVRALKPVAVHSCVAKKRENGINEHSINAGSTASNQPTPIPTFTGKFNQHKVQNSNTYPLKFSNDPFMGYSEDIQHQH